jgi:hypothetical protein
VRGLPLFRPDSLHPDGLAASLDHPLALAGNLLHGGPDNLHALLSSILGIFIRHVHTVTQVLLTNALQVIHPSHYPQPQVSISELASLDSLLGFCLGLGLLPCLDHCINSDLDMLGGCSLGLLLQLLVRAWHPDIMGPFLGQEKPLAGHNLISLLDHNLRVFLLLGA